MDTVVTVPDIILGNPAPVDLEPWNKFRDETHRAYAAFLSYRDLPTGHRSLTRAAAAFYITATRAKVRQMQTWSSRHSWVDRANAWDDYLQRTANEDLIEKIRSANEYHVKVANGLINLALKRLSEMKENELSPTEALRYIVDGIRIHRMALGEPTEIIENESTDNVTALTIEMTDEQLRQRLLAIRASKLTK